MITEGDVGLTLYTSGGKRRKTNICNQADSHPPFPKFWVQHIRPRNLHVRVCLKARLRIKRLKFTLGPFFPWTSSRSAEINSLIVEGTYLTLELDSSISLITPLTDSPFTEVPLKWGDAQICNVSTSIHLSSYPSICCLACLCLT